MQKQLQPAWCGYQATTSICPYLTPTVMAWNRDTWINSRTLQGLTQPGGVMGLLTGGPGHMGSQQSSGHHARGTRATWKCSGLEACCCKAEPALPTDQREELGSLWSLKSMELIQAPSPLLLIRRMSHCVITTPAFERRSDL